MCYINGESIVKTEKRSLESIPRPALLSSFHFKSILYFYLSYDVTYLYKLSVVKQVYTFSGFLMFCR